METINRSYLLKEYYGNEFFYDTIEEANKQNENNYG